MSEQESNEQGAGSGAKPALQLEGVETWKAYAERWFAEDEMPSEALFEAQWIKGDEKVRLDVGINTYSDSRIAIAMTVDIRDHLPRIISAQVVATYILADVRGLEGPPEVGNIDDVDAYFASLEQGPRLFIINTGIADIVPYLRELVQSLSVRLFPNDPVVLSNSIVIEASKVERLSS
ncbi:hypothetical protein AB0H71_15005 [Nocardia sp. NPDC050697]|uniref:hypothetical protein n=1 Tax=Nocardia sp. NPDC050697 TaxID=3155158 RepID=UPI0034116319